jgi:hypothetical protein
MQAEMPESKGKDKDYGKGKRKYKEVLGNGADILPQVLSRPYADEG